MLLSNGQVLNYHKVKFSSNLNCEQKIVSEMGPWFYHSHCSVVCIIVLYWTVLQWYHLLYIIGKWVNIWYTIPISGEALYERNSLYIVSYANASNIIWQFAAGLDLVHESHNVPVCTSPASHNAPFCNRNAHMCAHFCYKMVHCGIFVLHCGVCEMGLIN